MDIGYPWIPVDIPCFIGDFLFQTILCLSIHDHNSHHCGPLLEAFDTESLVEVLIELSLLIGTDATTPFIQERCHWAGWHPRVNYRQFRICKGCFYQIWVELGKATPTSLVDATYPSFHVSFWQKWRLTIIFFTLEVDEVFLFDRIYDLLMFSLFPFPNSGLVLQKHKLYGQIGLRMGQVWVLNVGCQAGPYLWTSDDLIFNAWCIVVGTLWTHYPLNFNVSWHIEICYETRVTNWCML